MVRESVREYSSAPVEQEKLEYLLDAARLAPSACNRQPWKFFVLRSVEARGKACQAASRFPWIATAPVVLLCCIDHDQEWVRSYDKKPHGNIDIAIAVEHICLAAAEQGLGTCWVCSFDAALCKSLLGLPENLEPAVIIPLGYPAGSGPRQKSRKELQDIVEYL